MSWTNIYLSIRWKRKSSNDLIGDETDLWPQRETFTVDVSSDLGSTGTVEWEREREHELSWMNEVEGDEFDHLPRLWIGGEAQSSTQPLHASRGAPTRRMHGNNSRSGVTETNLHLHVKETRREDGERLRSFLGSLVSSSPDSAIYLSFTNTHFPSPMIDSRGPTQIFWFGW